MSAQRGAADVAEEFQERIQRFFRGRCPNPEDAEDMAQEALCAILEGYGRFRGLSSPSTWVYAICRNVYGSHMYYGMRRHRLTRALHAVPESGPSETPTELRILMEDLSPAERELYDLFYVQDLGIRAIGARLGRPEGTVKYLLFRLRRRIRDMIE